MISLGHAIEIALLLLATYLVGCVLGYAAHRAWRARGGRVSASASDSPPQPVPTLQPVQSPARRLARAAELDTTPRPSPDAARQRPPDLPGPLSGGADDLKQIKGIGAKTEAALNDLGIYHFHQIAAWTQPNVDWLEGRIAVKGRIAREQWIEQATLFATATRAA